MHKNRVEVLAPIYSIGVMVEASIAYLVRIKLCSKASGH